MRSRYRSNCAQRKHSPRAPRVGPRRQLPLASPAADERHTAAMPLAQDRLEVLQVRKLVQCVRTGDKAQITKLVQHGISGLINYQGIYRGTVHAIIKQFT